MLLAGELAKAEPKALRYRLLHVAARMTRGQRRVHARLPELAVAARTARRVYPPGRPAPADAGLTAASVPRPPTTQGPGATGTEPSWLRRRVVV
jgi:hypothetical protein